VSLIHVALLRSRGPTFLTQFMVKFSLPESQLVRRKGGTVNQDEANATADNCWADAPFRPPLVRHDPRRRLFALCCCSLRYRRTPLLGRLLAVVPPRCFLSAAVPSRRSLSCAAELRVGTPRSLPPWAPSPWRRRRTHCLTWPRYGWRGFGCCCGSMVTVEGAAPVSVWDGRGCWRGRRQADRSRAGGGR